MGNLSQDQLDRIEKFLNDEGIGYEPLRSELFDHIISDFEMQIRIGKNYEDIEKEILGNVPVNHFKQIEKEVMDTVNKKFNLSRSLSYFGLGLLLISTFFKLLHLPLTGVLLLSSFGLFGLSLFVGVIKGTSIYNDKTGKIMLIGLTIGVIFFLISWSFQILQLPSFVGLNSIAISLMVILFPLVTFKLLSASDNSDNVLSFLHWKNRNGINKFLYVTLLLGIAIQAYITFYYGNRMFPELLLIITIGAGGLQFFALNWHSDVNRNNHYLKYLLIFSFILFILPSFDSSIMNWNIKYTLATGFYLVGAIIVFKNLKGSDNYLLNSFILILVSILYLLWFGFQSQILTGNYVSFLFNPMIFLLLGVSLYFTRKEIILNTYLIIVMAHYTYEYGRFLISQ